MDKQKAAALSIFSNTALIFFKIVVGILMGSVSVISEAIHSSIDLLASLIAFFSIKVASKAEDDGHPFGHGKYENVSGFVEALLILLAAALIIYQAIKRIFIGGTVDNVGAGILVMLLAAVVNFFISMILLKTAKKTDSIALEADGMHLLTDVYTSIGVFLGLVLLKITNIPIIDPLTAIFVAILIIKTSIDLIKKSLNDLVDSKLPDDDILKILNILDSHLEITKYHSLKTRKSGPTREINVNVHVVENTSLVDAHNLSDTVEKEIKDIFPGGSYVLIHIEPENS
ncbi:cation diffusion facilitator family transporter [Clostridium estertheticum]|uniref:cation diffusion facilitator family transporter n=1 Tax=Clostridium estertheticum TaxID=238834 RepID=UPI001C0B2748|nr:cation diffusion facilitator family transporter [Clostridium estertheticum]MBU3216041.1 cation diffusion facilitator family transporter [Clostridium estertheticum]WAG55971.1 cation diffusion facilitator family transporter [Clostridium estertheticum]